MKDELSLDDLSLFLAVCAAGGLADAVEGTGQSAPTLSRKMTALERQTGRRLFVRGNKGYALTAEGRALRDEAEALSDIRRRLSGWSGGRGPVRVRITAGAFTSCWLAANLGRFWTQGDGWVPEFLSSNAVLDIARREADIGFRNRRPDQNWLAGRRMRRIEFAEYASSDRVTGYVTLSKNVASAPSPRWVWANRESQIVTTVSDARLAMDMARQGIARAVLPTFAGDKEPDLIRVSDVIADLAHDEWLVTHHEARHDPPVRKAIDAITRFVEEAA